MTPYETGQHEQIALALDETKTASHATSPTGSARGPAQAEQTDTLPAHLQHTRIASESSSQQSFGDLGWFVPTDEWWTRVTPPGSPVTDSVLRYEADTRNSIPRLILLADRAGLVAGVGLGGRTGSTDSFRITVRFEDWRGTHPFDIQHAIDSLRGQTRRAAGNVASLAMGRFTSTASQGIAEWLRREHPDTLAAAYEMLGAPTPAWLAQVDSPAAALYGQQIDAWKVGLDVAGLDRTAAMSHMAPPAGPQDSPLLTNMLEDQIIHDDIRVIPGFVAEHARFGARFEDDQGRRLTTLLANKQPLESLTGADVIYYNSYYEAFILVQYKRCRIESGKSIYRYDDDYKRESTTLRELQGIDPGRATGPHTHRLSAHFAFIKLCESRQPHDPSLSTGMYFDVDAFEAAREAGPKGGLRVDYKEVSRYITNTTFIDLLAQGWVGSRGNQTRTLFEKVEQGLNNDRAVIFAQIDLPDGKRGRASGSLRAHKVQTT